MIEKLQEQIYDLDGFSIPVELSHMWKFEDYRDKFLANSLGSFYECFLSKVPQFFIEKGSVDDGVAEYSLQFCPFVDEYFWAIEQTGCLIFAYCCFDHRKNGVLEQYFGVTLPDLEVSVQHVKDGKEEEFELQGYSFRDWCLKLVEVKGDLRKF